MTTEKENLEILKGKKSAEYMEEGFVLCLKEGASCICLGGKKKRKRVGVACRPLSKEKKKGLGSVLLGGKEATVFNTSLSLEDSQKFSSRAGRGTRYLTATKEGGYGAC